MDKIQSTWFAPDPEPYSDTNILLSEQSKVYRSYINFCPNLADTEHGLHLNLMHTMIQIYCRLRNLKSIETTLLLVKMCAGGAGWAARQAH